MNIADVVTPLHRALALFGCLALAAIPGARAAGHEPIDPRLRAQLVKAASQTDSFADRFDGEVWLLDMSQRLARRVPDARFRLELLKNVHYEARRAGLSPGLVLSVIDVESGFDPFAISPAGARGLMQVMPFWLKEIGRPGDSLFQVRTNLRYGCTILAYYLDQEHGNLQRALRRYNGTTAPQYALLVSRLMHTRWFSQ